jgi:hypothetical protein
VSMSTNDELKLRDYAFAERTLTRLDRICCQYVQGLLGAKEAMERITNEVSAWTDPEGPAPDYSERRLVPYTLPDGRVVQCDDSACKGAHVIDFTLADGTIVKALRGGR